MKLQRAIAFLATLYVCALHVPSLGASRSVDAQEILNKADSHRAPSGELSFTVDVRDFEQSQEVRKTTYRVYAKHGKSALVETTEPARLVGRKLLMRGSELWMFLPNIKRPTRVSLQQRLTGEVSNGDLARTEFRQDYRPQNMGISLLGKVKCYKLKLNAKHKDTTYKTIHLWVDKKSLRPVQADFFALSGKRLKRSHYSHFKKTLGQLRSTVVTIEDALQPKRYSRLEYSAFKKERFADSFFNKESLL